MVGLSLINSAEDLAEYRKRTADLEKEIRARGPYVWAGYSRTKKTQYASWDGVLKDEWTSAEDIYLLACAYAGKHSY